MPLDVVGVAGEGGAEDGGDPDRVLVDVGLDVLGPDHVLALAQADDPRFDVEVAAELFPDDVDVAAKDEVRLLDRAAGRFLALLPLPLQREGAEHDRLRGALGAAAGRLAGGVVEVGEHADAALLDLGRDRILGVVDEVAVQVLGDDPLRLGLHPGGDEGGQVAPRVALQHQFLVDQPQRVERRHAARRGTPCRGRPRSGSGRRRALLPPRVSATGSSPAALLVGGWGEPSRNWLGRWPIYIEPAMLRPGRQIEKLSQSRGTGSDER